MSRTRWIFIFVDNGERPVDRNQSFNRLNGTYPSVRDGTHFDDSIRHGVTGTGSGSDGGHLFERRPSKFESAASLPVTKRKIIRHST